MPITATGIGSGLDVESLVSQLSLQTFSQLKTLEHERGILSSPATAYGSVKACLSQFQAAAASAGAAGQYTGKLANTALYRYGYGHGHVERGRWRL